MTTLLTYYDNIKVSWDSDDTSFWMQVLSPSAALENARRNHTPTEFFRKANSIHLPRGAAPGQAWLLMSRRELENLTGDLLRINWQHDRGVTVFKNWVFVSAVSIDISLPDTMSASYLCYFEDIRRLFQCSSTSTQYNVRIPAPPTDDSVAASDEYYRETLSGSDLWTWDEILEDLWDDIWHDMGATRAVPDAPTLGSPPAGTPDNLRFIGLSAWEAFCSVCEMCGHTFVHDSVNDTFTLKKLSAVQGEVDNADTDNTNRKIFDANPWTLGNWLTRPRTIRVFFPKRVAYAGTERDTPASNNWEVAPYHSIDVPNPQALGSGVLPVWGDKYALFADLVGPSNLVDLEARSAEIAADLGGRPVYSDEPLARIFSGVLTSVMPGAQLGKVVWRDYGDTLGPVTEWITRPQAQWEAARVNACLRPVDFNRVARPNYPQYAQMVKITGAWDATAQVYPGKVVLNMEGTWKVLDDCWVQSTSATDIALYDDAVAVGAQYHGPARLSGLLEAGGTMKPVYLLEDTPPRKAYIEFILTQDLTVAMEEATATIAFEWGPGPSAGPVGTAVVVVNMMTSTGDYKYWGSTGHHGYAIHVETDHYRIIDKEC